MIDYTNNYFIGLDNRTNALSCNLEQSRPKSAFEKLQANKAAHLILSAIKERKNLENYFIWGEPNLCESILFDAKNSGIKTAIAVEHINRGGLAIPSTKDIIEIISIFDPELLSVKVFFESQRSKLAEELAVERLLNLIDICGTYSKGLIIDVDYKINLNKNKNHSEKEVILQGVENLINKDIKPRFWGIRNTGDKTFDQTMIALMNLENEDSNKCILEYPHNVNKPNLYSESEIKNYVLNSDIFLNNLIAWSTKQSEDSETILNINNEIEKFENTIYETNLTKIIQ